jgi:hypothetical protein
MNVHAGCGLMAMRTEYHTSGALPNLKVRGAQDRGPENGAGTEQHTVFCPVPASFSNQSRKQIWLKVVSNPR